MRSSRDTGTLADDEAMNACTTCPRRATHTLHGQPCCRDCYEAAVQREVRESGNGWLVGRWPVEKRKPKKETTNER